MNQDPASGLHQCMSVEQFTGLQIGTPVADHSGRIGIVIQKSAAGRVVVAYGNEDEGGLSAHYDAFDLLGPCVLRWDGERWGLADDQDSR